VAFLAPVVVLAGEDELLALAEGALRVLSGEEPARCYGELKR
jgi:butyrate kinase